MSVLLRTILLTSSVLVAAWILRKIQKCKVKQEDAVYWICFAIILALLGVFPQLAFKAAGLLGVQSPANFVFLAIIFLLLEKLLSLSIQVSMLESKMEIMAAELAIRCKDIEESKEKGSEGFDA